MQSINFYLRAGRNIQKTIVTGPYDDVILLLNTKGFGHFDSITDPSFPKSIFSLQKSCRKSEKMIFGRFFQFSANFPKSILRASCRLLFSIVSPHTHAVAPRRWLYFRFYYALYAMCTSSGPRTRPDITAHMQS